MSKELQELEDKLLFDEVDRRIKLLATVQGRHRHFDWYRFIRRLIFLSVLSVVADIFVWAGFNSDQIVALSLIVIVFLIWIDGATVDARMDALVRLLQEDGILRDTPLGVKHSESS